MNLPWDKSYFKLCFYVIFTFIVIYIFKNAIDIICYALFNMSGVFKAVFNGVSNVVSVFSVIIIGFIIAYVLNPLVEFFISHNIKRGLSVTAAFFILFLVFLGIILAVIINITNFFKYPLIEGINIQIDNFNKNIAFVNSYLVKYGIFDINSINFDFDKKIIYKYGKYVTQFLLGIIISIYFLKDKNNILYKISIYKSIFPKKIVNFLEYILKNLNRAFSGYIRGQLADASIMAALFSFSLSVIKLPFAIPVGVICGFLNVIPYFGAILGFVLAVLSGFLSGNFLRGVYAGIAIFLLQQVDSVFISPRVVGESTKLSPVIVIIALAVGANLFGILGMALAVPLVSFGKLIFNDWFRKRNLDNDKNNYA
ncbi:MAG: AI-2E family transporter [Lachnospirales bacterium]